MNAPTEAQCQATIIAAAMISGWRVHAERPGMTRSGNWATQIQGHPGYPDITMCRHNQLWFIELKKRPNKIEPAQQAWQDAINTAALSYAPARLNIAAFTVWVPEEQDAFIRQLTDGDPDITQFVYRDTVR